MTDEERAERLREWNRLGMDWADWDQWRKAVGRAHESFRVLLGRAFFCGALVDPVWVEGEHARLQALEDDLKTERHRLERAELDIIRDLKE